MILSAILRDASLATVLVCLICLSFAVKADNGGVFILVLSIMGCFLVLIYYEIRLPTIINVKRAPPTKLLSCIFI